jgi:hypothetical protein
MRGDEDDSKLFGEKAHRKLPGPGQFREKLGMAGKFVTRKRQGLLTDGSGDNGVEPFVTPQLHGRFNIFG